MKHKKKRSRKTRKSLPPRKANGQFRKRAHKRRR